MLPLLSCRLHMLHGLLPVPVLSLRRSKTAAAEVGRWHRHFSLCQTCMPVSAVNERCAYVVFWPVGRCTWNKSASVCRVAGAS